MQIVRKTTSNPRFKNYYACLQPNSEYAIADTGATDHFLVNQNALINPQKSKHPILVHQSNGATIPSTHHGHIQLGRTPVGATAHVLPNLAQLLLSIGKMCDVGCQAVFDNNTVTIIHNRKSVLSVHRSSDGLWKIPLPHAPTTITKEPTVKPSYANFTIHDATTKHIIKFLHLCLISPTKSTLLKALQNNHFVGWPALTQQNIAKHLQLEIPTILGHMDQQKQGTRSTKPKPELPHINTSKDETIEDMHVKTKMAFLALSELPSGRIYTDQTGSFPMVSSQGTKQS